MNKLIVNIDGGSRGNPGLSAFGVVFFYGDSLKVDKTYSKVIGVATNNEAEYQALIFALKKIKSLFGKEKAKNMKIEVRSDSQLLVSQINGKYKILDAKIQKLFLEAWNLKIDFNSLEVVYVPRERNKEADRLVNEALDAESRSQSLF